MLQVLLRGVSGPPKTRPSVPLPDPVAVAVAGLSSGVQLQSRDKNIKKVRRENDAQKSELNCLLKCLKYFVFTPIS